MIHYIFQDIEIGTKVLLKNNRRSDRKGDGFKQDPWLGPYVVIGRGSKGSYRLRNIHLDKILKKMYSGSQLTVYQEVDSPKRARREGAPSGSPIY
jgi:hypothetical protein